MRAAITGAWLCLATLLSASAVRAEPFDRLVPDTTIFYASIENIARTKERFKASALRGLWDDAAVQAFTKIPREKWDALMEEQKKKEGVTIQDVLDLVEGRIAFAVTDLTGPEADDPDLVILADIGEKGAQVKALIERAEALLLDGDNYRRLEDEFRGVTLVNYKSTQDDSEEGEGGARKVRHDEPAWFLHSNLFAMSTRVEDLKQVLALRDDPEARTLANHEAYRRVLARTGERSDVVLYVGAAAVLKALKNGPLQDEMKSRIVDAIGVNNIEAACLQASLGRGGIGVNMFLSVSGPKEGILKIFDGKNSGLKPPRWVPGDAISASTMVVDIPAIWEEMRRVVAKIDPNAIAQLDAGLEMAKGMTGIDIQTDLIGALGKEITSYVRPTPAGEADGGADATPASGMPHTVFALEVANKQKFDGALGALMMMAQGMYDSQNYQGVTIWVASMPQLPALGLLPNNQFLVAMHLDDLKEVINRQGKEFKGLIDSEDFNRGTGTLPEGRFMVGFSREAKALGSSQVLQMLKLTGVARRFVDLDLFPKEEVLAKYLGVGASALVNEEAGIYFTYHLGFKRTGSDD